MFDSGLPFLPPGKTKSLSRIALHRSRIAAAAAESGTRCSRPAFIRAAGTTQTLSRRSTSSHRAPITSPVRAAVRIRNSKRPRRDRLLDCASAAMKSGSSS